MSVDCITPAVIVPRPSTLATGWADTGLIIIETKSDNIKKTRKENQMLNMYQFELDIV